MNNKLIILMAGGLILTGCAGKIEKADPNPTPSGIKEGPGLLSGSSGNLMDAFKSETDDEAGGGSRLGVNAYLWRASLETVSFMPLQQVDSAGGTILTDWYVSPDKPNERVKINIYILGKSLRPQSLRVSVFKQELRKGTWTDVPADEKTAQQLEDTVLTKARVYRVQQQAVGN